MSEKSDWEKGYDQAMMRMYGERKALKARIAELEAETAMLKQLSQPIEFWSDEKIQIYKSNESRTMKSGYEEREE